MDPLSVGIIGLSHLHPHSYMPIFKAAGFQVAAVAEADQAVREPFTRDFNVTDYADWHEMIERERLDLAAIYLPHALCPQAAAACAARGIHVLVEKPMAAAPGGAQCMIEAARRAMSGGGPMHNLGVHWIDLYRWLLQDEPVEVFGKNVKVNEQYDIEDNSFALVTFSRGAVLALDINYTIPDSYPYGRDLYLSVRGTTGVTSWSPSFEGIHERLFVCSDAAEFTDSPRRHIEFELEKHPGYTGILGVHYLSDVAKAIRGGGPAPITGEDGLRALETVEAIYESAPTGRSVSVQGIRA